MASSAPPYSFSVKDKLSEFTVSADEYMRAHDQHESGLASGALVYDSKDRVLLVQRAAHDSQPNCWETPGGAVDSTDSTILHGVARELFEESGLVAKSFERLVGEDYIFQVRYLRIEKFTFVVEVEDVSVVTLDPDEHQRYVWATEEDCRGMGVGGRRGGSENMGLEKAFTFPKQKDIVLEGFGVRREMKQGRASKLV